MSNFSLPDQLLIKCIFSCVQHLILLCCSRWGQQDCCSPRGNEVSQGSSTSAIPVLCSSLFRYGFPPCCFFLFTCVRDCSYLTWISFHLRRIFFFLPNKVNLGKWKAVGEKYLFPEGVGSGLQVDDCCSRSAGNFCQVHGTELQDLVCASCLKWRDRGSHLCPRANLLPCFAAIGFTTKNQLPWFPLGGRLACKGSSLRSLQHQVSALCSLPSRSKRWSLLKDPGREPLVLCSVT